MTACGFDYPATRPAAGAAGATCGRCWPSASTWPASADWQASPPWWNSERRIRAHHHAAGAPHRPDAEIHWPSRAGQPNEGQVWAVEVELTPKQIGPPIAIMDALLDPASGYDRVIYYAARPAQPVLDPRRRLPPGRPTARSPSPTSPPPPPCPACPDHRQRTTIIMTDNGTGNDSNNIPAGAAKRPVNTAGNSRTGYFRDAGNQLQFK